MDEGVLSKNLIRDAQECVTGGTMAASPRLRGLPGVRNLIDAAIEDCVRDLCNIAVSKGLQPPIRFTTADIVRHMAEIYPEIWLLLVNIYPIKGGRFTARSYVAKALDALANQGVIRRRGLTTAPPDWGAPDVAEYECIT